MIDPGNALQKAIYLSLKPTLDTAGIKIADGVGQKQAPPYVIIGDDDIDEEPNTCGDLFDCLCLIRCYGVGVSRKATKEIASIVKNALETNPPQAAGFYATTSNWEGVSYQAVDSGRRHSAIVRLRVLITAN